MLVYRMLVATPYLLTQYWMSSTCPVCRAQWWHLSSMRTTNLWMPSFSPYKPYVQCQHPTSTTWHSCSQVKHVLKSRWTGTCDGSGMAHYFSPNNCRDHTVKETKGTGPSMKTFMKIDPHASQFLKSAKDLTDKHWAEIFVAAKAFLNNSHKRERSQSASSLASSDFIKDSVPNYSFVSDSD